MPSGLQYKIEAGVAQQGYLFDPRCRLELFSEDPSKIEESRNTVRRMERALRQGYLDHPGTKSVDIKLLHLFKDLENGRFWGVISAIDGHYLDYQEQKQEKRTWARKTFNTQELENLFNICVNQALLGPFDGGWPGLRRGHSTLYEEFIDKGDSMFYSSISEKFKRKLNNGRFWEELSDMSYGLNGGRSFLRVGDVLENHFDELDLTFAPKGFELFYRAAGQARNFRLGGLSDKAIDRYREFVRKLDERRNNLKLNKSDLEFLITPYVRGIIATKEAEDEPRFKDFKERLQEGFVRDYLTSEHSSISNPVIDSLTEELALHAEYGSYGIEHDNVRYVMEILPYLPNPKNMFARMLIKMGSYGVEKLFETLGKIGHDSLSSFLTPKRIKVEDKIRRVG